MVLTTKQKAIFQRAKEWIEEKGLYPEPCGETIAEFIKMFDIDFKTYQKWMKEESDFSIMVKEANKVFGAKIARKAEAGLMKLVEGYEEWEEFQEGMPDGKGGVIIKKLSRRKKIIAPNLGAITFVLCNRMPDRWTNPQKVEVQGAVGIGELSDEEMTNIIRKMKDAVKG